MIVPALYFLSGAAGLVLESVILRQFSWLAGSATAATALVLAAFLGGLAAGSALLGPMADRVARPLRLYGRLELGAGLAGLIVVALLSQGREALLFPLRAIGLGGAAQLSTFCLAFALLLVPTALMGGSLPALARFAVSDPKTLLRPLGVLYGINTLGGAFGAFGAGFFLFESLGVAGTGALAGAAQIAVGVAALLLDRRLDASPLAAPASPRRGTPRATPRTHPGSRRRFAILAAAGTSGGAVLGYEVLWTRLLTLPMRSTAYSFSLMLSLFLLGLVLGALTVAAFASKQHEPARLLAWLEVGMGCIVASSLLWLPGLLVPPQAGSFPGFLVQAVLRAGPIVLPATILSGMVLPLACLAVGPSPEALGRDVGRVYAINTLGSILGALATGLVLLPAMGVQRSLALLAAVNAGAGVLLLWSMSARASRLWVASVLALACLLPAVLPGERIVRGFLRAGGGNDKTGEVLLFHEGVSDTIAIVRKEYGFHDPGAKSLITNGVAMSATVKPVWRYMAVEGHLPVLLARAPKRALVICLGTGITLGAVASHPRLESIDAVELSDGVIEGLDLFAVENGGVRHDPRVRLIREDGRHFLEMTEGLYEAITLEPPPPIVAGSVNLYSADFYRICRRRMAPGGVLAQWLPLHAQSLASARMTASTFLAAFPYVQLWLPSIRDAVLVGSDRPLELDLARVQAAYADSRTRANLEAAYLETPEAFLSTFLLDRAGVERWAAGAPVITDDRPLMEFFRGRGPNMSDRDIGTLLEVVQGSRDWIHGIGSTAEPSRRIEEENHALRLYVRAEVENVGEPGIEAARRSRGTQFFLYRLGCADAQLEFLARSPSQGSLYAAQSRRCASLRSGAP